MIKSNLLIAWMDRETAKKLLHEALDETAPKKKNPYNKKPRVSPILIILIACLVLVGVQYLSSSDTEVSNAPYGKITSPIYCLPHPMNP
jgi:hypothetical protein